LSTGKAILTIETDFPPHAAAITVQGTGGTSECNTGANCFVPFLSLPRLTSASHIYLIFVKNKKIKCRYH
jgi:hypothetical protein